MAPTSAKDTKRPPAQNIAPPPFTNASRAPPAPAIPRTPNDPEVALALWRRQQQQRQQQGLPPLAAPLPPRPRPVQGRKRGRPKGSTDSKPRKKYAKKNPAPEPPKFESDADRRACEEARKKIVAGIRRHDMAKLREEKAREELAKAQKAFDQARNITSKADEDVKSIAAEVADDLLREVTPWNGFYRRLVAFKESEGHCNFKRDHKKEDYAHLSPELQQEYKTLSWWSGRQRTAKRTDRLEKYQEVLLDRVGFCWSPSQGPGPEKWNKKFAMLKEYYREHGDFKVPDDYPPCPNLSSFVKTQITQYRNGLAGKKPFLSEERIRLMEETGFSWGAPRVVTPWSTRFSELLRYREEFGNVHVPWRWKRNRPLAAWVNAQRKKYKEIQDGKKTTLTAEQVQKLNDIGFKWSTGGSGKYDRGLEQQAPMQQLQVQAQAHTGPVGSNPKRRDREKEQSAPE